MCELTDAKRQQVDMEFITSLNSLRVGNFSDDHARIVPKFCGNIK